MQYTIYIYRLNQPQMPPSPRQQGNSTTLHLACQGKVEILKILLEAGSDVNAKDDVSILPV